MGRYDHHRGQAKRSFDHIEFARDTMFAPTMSPAHMLKLFEKNAGPLANLVKALADDPIKLSNLRNAAQVLIEKFFSNKNPDYRCFALQYQPRGSCTRLTFFRFHRSCG